MRNYISIKSKGFWRYRLHNRKVVSGRWVSLDKVVWC